MTNEYLYQFTVKKDLDQFLGWLHINASLFVKNMENLNSAEPKELREWIRLFLLWSEYEDNKDGD